MFGDEEAREFVVITQHLLDALDRGGGARADGKGGPQIREGCEPALAVVEEVHLHARSVRPRIGPGPARVTRMDALIFDFDGVIADSEPVHERAITRAAQMLGVPFTHDDYMTRVIGLDDRDTFRVIAEMGGLAELSAQEAVDALIHRNLELADAVVVRDKKLDALEAEVDRLAVRVIALRAPMADDLREVVAALKIAGMLERIGDYAKNIAKRVERIEVSKAFEPLTLLPAMAEVATDMVHDVMTAYAARDAALALDVIERDTKVDAFYNSIFRNLVSHMIENPSTISSAAQLLFITRNLERIGDHATNVAEMVHFAALGTYPVEQ